MATEIRNAIDQVDPDDPRRIAFSNLHTYSVIVLGIAMIAALVAFMRGAHRARRQFQGTGRTYWWR